MSGLQATVNAQEVNLDDMVGYLAGSAPDFKLGMSELSNLRAQLAKQEKDSPAPVGKATTDGDYITRYREFKYQETLFELFSKQFELAKVDEAREGAVIQVLDAAQAPERKSKPKKAMIAIMATLASGFALLLFVFLRQALSNAGQDSESSQKMSNIKNSWRRAIGRV